MINNFTNINKTNNDLSPYLIEHNKDHDIKRWKIRYAGFGRKFGRVKSVH